MAENDVILNLKIDGAEAFVNSLNESAKATANLGDSTKKSQKEVDSFSKTLNDSAKEADRISEIYSSLTDEMNATGKGFVTTADKIKALSAILKSNKKEFEESEKKAKELKAQIDKIAPGTAQKALIDEYNKIQQAMERTSNDSKILNNEMANLRSGSANLKKELAGVKMAMAQMKLAGQENTETYIKMQDEAGRLGRALKDAAFDIDDTSSKTQGLDDALDNLALGTNVFTVMQGGMALVGQESENVGKAMVKLNALMAINQSIQQISIEYQKTDNSFKRAGVIANRAYALAVGQSTEAMKLFRLALISTGIGALALGLLALVSNWDKVTEAIGRVFPSLAKFGDMWNGIKDKFNGFLNATKAGLAEYLKTFGRIGKLISDVFNPNVKLKDAWKNFTDGVQDGANNIKKAFKEGADESARIRQITEGIAKIEKQILEARTKGADKSAVARLEMGKLVLEQQKLTKGSNEYLEKQIEINEKSKELNEVTKGTSKNLDKTLEAQNKLNQELEVQVGSIKAMQEEYNKYLDIANRATVGSKEWSSALESAKKVSEKIEKVQKAINDKLEKNKDITELWKTLMESTGKVKEPNFLNGLAESFNTNLENEKRLLEEIEKGFSDNIDFQISELKRKERAELESAEKTGANKYLITAYYDRKIRELTEKQIADKKALRANEDSEEQKRHDDRINRLKGNASLTAQLANDGFSIFKAVNDAQKQLLDNRLKAGLISQQEYAREVAKLNEKQARADKVKAVFDATIAVAVAVASAIKNPIKAAIIAALGAAQIAAIVATPIPKFFKGVIGLKRGQNKRGRDTIPAMLNEGESVMTTAETKRHRPVLEAIRQKRFEDLYIKRSEIKDRQLAPIVSFSGDSNRKIEKELKYMNSLLGGIMSNTHLGAEYSGQMNRFIRKNKRSRERRYFV